ncbi:malate:quinone oxidoreductase [Staphylococcus epidermidis]|nr:malate:quinone oxidoreductase [Staphylococcus epidermidis]
MGMCEKKEVVLIGGGVVSSRFGCMLKRIGGDWEIDLYEGVDGGGIES